MNIKQILNLASFYTKKAKNREFEANHAKQGIKTANQNSLTRLKSNQKTGFSAESQTQRGLDELSGLKGMRRLRGARFAEYGRSMVEMLGVLAVIGVLSVAGMMGYRYAMDKYRANDIIYEVNLRSTDIWHKYQEQALPLPTDEETDFPEYALLTSTGFPIYVESYPDVAYKIYVENVPSGVCKQVLNMDMVGVIHALQFAEVNGVRYEGSNAICGDGIVNNQLVFTAFLDYKQQNQNVCLEDRDCPSCCGTSYCDENTLTCTSVCNDPQKPYCLCNSDNTSGTCVECRTNEDCGESEVCDPANYQCVIIPEKCEPGVSYRSKTGACIPCSFASEIVIMNNDDNGGIFEKEVAGTLIKDDTSGAAQCMACPGDTHRVAEIDNGDVKTTYCAVSCIKGEEFMSKSNGCIPCGSSTETDIPSDDQSLLLCASCSNRVWFRESSTATPRCVLKECPDGYFKNKGKCRKCKLNPSSDCYSGAWPNCYDYYSAVLWYKSFLVSDQSVVSKWREECTECQSASNDSLREEHTPIDTNNYTYCPRSCPNDGQHFQDFYGRCYTCDTDEKPSLVLNGMTNTYIRNMCTSCAEPNKRIISGNYCIKDEEVDCSDGILSNNNTCYACDDEKLTIGVAGPTGSGCEENCGDTYYLASSTACYRKCPSTGYFQDKYGNCHECSKLGDGYELGTWEFTYNETVMGGMCRACGDYDIFKKGGTHTCAPTKCAKGNKFRNAYGKCVSCTSAGTTVDVGSYKDECLACGNRLYINNYCVLYNPGTSGVCNNDGQDGFPDYSAGEGIKYRDNTGMCRNCADKNTAYAASTEECTSCDPLTGPRRIADGQCVYGGCIEGETFQITSSDCISCTTPSAKESIASNNGAETLCTSCGRRVMTIGVDDDVKSYCVQSCASGEWQDVDGKCHDGAVSTATNEIGSDTTSQNLCEYAGRVVEIDESSRYYCVEE